MIAALFVQAGGAYFGLADVDPWDAVRDARTYAGPHPVVAHPPCERWGRYFDGGPSARGRFAKGADDGCFVAALTAVRQWGGVLEHPAGSSAWTHHGLITPSRAGGWVAAGDGGWTCCVDQGHYGHRASKATWLYAHGVRALPSLVWGPSGHRLELPDDPVRRARLIKTGVCQRLSKKQRAATPPAFRDMLIQIAMAAHRRQNADVFIFLAQPGGNA